MSSESYREGDAGQALDYRYTDENGDDVSLTGQTVQVIFQAPSGALKTRSAVLQTGDIVARYVIDAADFDEVGVWFREFRATGVSFTDTTAPKAFYVGPRLSGD